MDTTTHGDGCPRARTTRPLTSDPKFGFHSPWIKIMAHALARRIRNAAVQDADLAGFSPQDAQELVQKAFSQPILSEAPLCIALLVAWGGSRNKYHPDLQKQLVKALVSAGFTEDSTASANSSQGVYKLQLLKDKGNKSEVLVFPRRTTGLTSSASAEVAPPQSSEVDEETKDSPERAFLTADFEDSSDKSEFHKLFEKHIGSYTQCRSLLRFLIEAEERIKECEHSLQARRGKKAVLSRKDQTFFETTKSLPDKVSFVTARATSFLREGPLTVVERKNLLETMEEKLAEIERRLVASADSEVHVSKLERRKADLLRKQAAVKAVQASPAEFRKVGEYKRLLREWTELIRIENTKVTQSLATIKRLNAKPSVQAHMQAIEEENRRWFEGEDDFRERLSAALGTARESTSTTAEHKSSASVIGRSTKFSASEVWSAPVPRRRVRRQKQITRSSDNPWDALESESDDDGGASGDGSDEADEELERQQTGGKAKRKRKGKAKGKSKSKNATHASSDSADDAAAADGADGGTDDEVAASQSHKPTATSGSTAWRTPILSAAVLFAVFVLLLLWTRGSGRQTRNS